MTVAIYGYVVRNEKGDFWSPPIGWIPADDVRNGAGFSLYTPEEVQNFGRVPAIGGHWEPFSGFEPETEGVK